MAKIHLNKVGQQQEAATGIGVKHDAGKPRWSLLPLNAIKTVLDVLEYGARKYSVGNWEKLPDPMNRYFDACMRHLCSSREGEELDPETKLSHLAHATCCLLFMLSFELKNKAK